MVSDEADSYHVTKCLAGDIEAFQPLIERYQRLLFVVAFRMLDNREDAIDAAQSAFVRAFEKLATFERRNKFFSWLYRILVNECLHVRRMRRDRQPLDPEMMGTADPGMDFQRAETRAQTRAAVARLPRALREVIVLRHFAEMSYQEIAEALDLPEKTVKSRLHEARKQLGQLLLGWKNER